MKERIICCNLWTQRRFRLRAHGNCRSCWRASSAVVSVGEKQYELTSNVFVVGGQLIDSVQQVLGGVRPMSRVTAGRAASCGRRGDAQKVVHEIDAAD